MTVSSDSCISFSCFCPLCCADLHIVQHADFIVDGGAELPDEDGGRGIHRRPLLPREDEQEDVEALERRIQARYARSSHTEYDEETTDVEQQALLPSVRDPKLWMVKCAVCYFILCSSFLLVIYFACLSVHPKIFFFFIFFFLVLFLLLSRLVILFNCVKEC